MDWGARVGTIKRLVRSNRHRQCYVVWDGNTSLNQVFVGDLEVIND